MGEEVLRSTGLPPELEVSVSSEVRKGRPDLRRCGEMPSFFFFFAPVAEGKKNLYTKAEVLWILMVQGMSAG